MSKKCVAFSKSKLGLETADNRKSFYAGWDAALAEQAEQACPNGCDTSNGRCVDCPDYVAEQAEQEPVGMVIGGVFEPWNDDILSGAHELYAAPTRTKDQYHPWQDLTDDEIDKLHSLDKFWDAHADDIFRYMDFARAIIAAFKEKNLIK